MADKDQNEHVLNVVNVVGSGSIDTELELSSLHCSLQDMDSIFSQYEQETLPAVKIRFEEGGPLTMIYRTGKYVITGASSTHALHTTDSELLSLLVELGIIDDAFETHMDVSNIVCVGNLNRHLNLEVLSIELGLEYTEYEPEQSPFLIYRPLNPSCVMTIANSGRTMITGIRGQETAEEAFRKLEDRLRDNGTESS